jgi:hypothetical protein
MTGVAGNVVMSNLNSNEAALSPLVGFLVS